MKNKIHKPLDTKRLRIDKLRSIEMETKCFTSKWQTLDIDQKSILKETCMFEVLLDKVYIY